MSWLSERRLGSQRTVIVFINSGDSSRSKSSSSAVGTASSGSCKWILCAVTPGQRSSNCV